MKQLCRCTAVDAVSLAVYIKSVTDHICGPLRKLAELLLVISLSVFEIGIFDAELITGRRSRGKDGFVERSPERRLDPDMIRMPRDSCNFARQLRHPKFMQHVHGIQS